MKRLRNLAAMAALVALTAGPALLRAAEPAAPLPRLVDLGAGKCIPCKQMKPILDELARDYAAQFETVFIDVWENREDGRRYGIRMIPTQIFYGPDGKELFRHEGFFSKEEILAKWRELGIAIVPPAAPTPARPSR